MTPGVFIFISMIFYVTSSYSLQRLCKKLEIKPTWLSWTPFSPVLMYKAGGQAWWWFILLLFPFIQFIALIVLLIAWVRIFQRSGWKLAIVPLISSILFEVSIGGSILLFIVSFMTSSPPYKMAVEQVKQNSMVVESLGKPISTGWFVQGNLTTSFDGGSACLVIPVSGSKTKGEIYVDAQQQNGEWNFRELVVEVEGRNEPIVLAAPPPGSQGSLCF
ncbi:cytochrome c oxidase assembly factor Coa1 family protein [Leptolyngbya sp. 'hensonii']|uniref:cytochrome c oxidase assembly factor Coa1 family protein n=1 Tax=Leptolyngbya sp. 'hensonii' TaxID=1922337 RepID=UPI0015C532A2|nr:cytochrome c oxidase assembly factor Coa1 family protein [Leptolyngbya sp. 'hensonii']